MGRTRQIKYNFFLNSKLGKLPPENRLLFAGLWCIADREGRLKDDPEKIKAQIFPYDNFDIDLLLNNLTDTDDPFIIRYSIDNKKYIQIANFKEHQHCHRNEAESKIPPIPDVGHTIDIPKTDVGHTIDRLRLPASTSTITSTDTSTSTYSENDDDVVVDNDSIKPSNEIIDEAFNGIITLGMTSKQANECLNKHGAYNFVIAYFGMLEKYNGNKLDNPIAYFMGILKNNTK